MRILMIEDDVALAHELSVLLHAEGYAVDHVAEGRDASAILPSEQYDGMILDLGMLEADGVTLLDRLRQSGERRVPVLILIAQDTPRERTLELDLGPDVYMRKPFEPIELELAIRGLRRRSGVYLIPPLTVGNLTIDYSTGKALRDGEALKLRGREWAVLEALVKHAGHVLSHDVITLVLGSDASLEPGAVEQTIHRVRKALGANLIRTVRGNGYLFERPSLTDNRI
jgi:two-component system OmpR family response regulator